MHSIVWQKQNAGWVGALQLTDERAAKVVVVGSRDIPKSVMIVCAASGEDPQIETYPFSEAATLLHPGNIVEIMCLQERIFGNSGMPAYPGAAD